MYCEPFDIPEPCSTIMIGWFAGGEVFRSGLTFERGNGRIFYFQPGHEEYPVYHNENVQKIITNGVRWAYCPYAAEHREIAIKNPAALEKTP